MAGSNASAPPMGARMRLKASKDISGFDPAMQKIFRAMKKYGLILADNGTDMYIGGTYDTRWDNDVLNPAFAALTASDFEFVRLGYMPQVPVRPGRGRHDGRDDVLRRQRRARARRDRARRADVDLPGVRRGDADGRALCAHGSGRRVLRRWATRRRPTERCRRSPPETARRSTAARRRATATASQVSNPAVRPAAHWDATLSRDAVDDGNPHVDAARRRQLLATCRDRTRSTRRSRRCFTTASRPGARRARSVPRTRSRARRWRSSSPTRWPGGGANIPVSGSANGHAYNCAAGGVSLFTDVAPTDMLLQARALPRRAERHARLLSHGLLPVGHRLAARDGRLHGEGRSSRREAARPCRRRTGPIP